MFRPDIEFNILGVFISIARVATNIIGGGGVPPRPIYCNGLRADINIIPDCQCRMEWLNVGGSSVQPEGITLTEGGCSDRRGLL